MSKQINIGKLLEGKSAGIDREIERLFPREMNEKWLNYALGKALYKYDAGTIHKTTSEPLWEFLDRGGKRWRPSLMLLCCEAVGGNADKIKEFVVFPELIHNSTLVEDDQEDRSELRRGKPCTYKLFGEDVAINLGSMMYMLPFVMLYKNTKKLSAKKKSEIYDMVVQELLRVHIGQATDIGWHRGMKENISEGEYLQMCINKTGCLSRLSCRLGALLGNGSEKQIEALGNFGASIGVAFQIQDDILNLVGEEFAKGKGFGEDIHEGKRTLLVLHVLKKTKGADAKRLVEILNAHPEDEGTINEAIGIIKKYGAIEYGKEKAREIVEKSWKEVDRALRKSDAKETLRAFADYLINRKI